MVKKKKFSVNKLNYEVIENLFTEIDFGEGFLSQEAILACGFESLTRNLNKKL